MFVHKQLENISFAHQFEFLFWTNFTIHFTIPYYFTSISPIKISCGRVERSDCLEIYTSKKIKSELHGNLTPIKSISAAGSFRSKYSVLFNSQLKESYSQGGTIKKKCQSRWSGWQTFFMLGLFLWHPVSIFSHWLLQIFLLGGANLGKIQRY